MGRNSGVGLGLDGLLCRRNALSLVTLSLHLDKLRSDGFGHQSNEQTIGQNWLGQIQIGHGGGAADGSGDDGDDVE